MQQADPAFHLETRGLNALGLELRNAFDGLKSSPRWKRTCRRCGKEKKGAVLVRVDVSQMFKRVTRGMVRGAVNRLLRRVEKRWGTQAVWERKRGQQKPSFILIRRHFRKEVKGCGASQPCGR